MPHVEPARLMELALGNDIANNDVSALRHIAACKRCWEELSLMTRVVIAARDVEESDLPTAPPERVWQRITQEMSENEKTAPPPRVKSVRSPSTASAEPRRTSRSMETYGRPVPLALGLLAGIAFACWWSRVHSKRHVGRRD